MAFSFNSGKRVAMAEINVTPLVDVMLVLLIIFMVTAPMMQEGVSVSIPDAKGTPLPRDSQKQEIVISVSAESTIYVNDKPMPEDRLAETILAATKDDPSRHVYLRADKSVPYGTVVRIMGALTTAGIKDLSVITQPREDTPRKK